MEGNISKKLFHRILLCLIVSCIFNLVLSCFLLYQWRERGAYLLSQAAFPLVFKEKPVTPSLTSVIDSMRNESIDSLMQKLKSDICVSDGYKERDIALALLLSYHRLDVGTTLSGSEAVQFGAITLYPDLSDRQLSELTCYLAERKWPFTSEGLFILLQKGQNEASLQSAFMHSEEYQLVRALLTRTYDGEVAIPDSEILPLLLSGNWNCVADLYCDEENGQDFSRLKRQQFLASYIPLSSRKAAELLLVYEKEFALHGLDDRSLSHLLSLFEVDQQLAISFVKELQAFRRGKEVRLACSRFVIQKQSLASPQVPGQTPTAVATQKVKEVRSKKDKLAKVITYTVQSGDSLWKIGKKFQVDIQALKEINRLSSEALRPGDTLQIPTK